MKRGKQLWGLGLLIVVAIALWDIGTAPSTAELFLTLWSEDIQQLQAEQKLPVEINDLKILAIQPLNQEAKNILEVIQPPFLSQTDGQFTLEILMDVWEEEGQKGVFLQYDLIAPDGNTLWELSRTILLPESSSLILSWYTEIME